MVVTHKYLTISSLCFFMVGICYLYSNMLINKIIGLSVFITSLTSIIFWQDGRQNTIKHRVDSMWIRFELLLLIIITLFNSNKRNKISIIFCLILLLGIALLYSDYFSSMHWCSPKHIYTHLITHFIFLTMLFVYYI